MKTTFTQEAIAGMTAEAIGEIIKTRVAAGGRLFEVVPIDEAIGRMAAMGVPVIGGLHALEVEDDGRDPEPPVPDSLDAAWAEAEAALPDGWYVHSVSSTGPTWLAVAGRRVPEWPRANRVVANSHACQGDTPAAALRDLASRLRDQGAPDA